MKHVQFSDHTHTAVISVFAGPQDEYYWPNMGVVEDDDPRYLLFLNPPPDYLYLARAERDRLIGYATLRINPLQDLVDLGESEPEDESLLLLWKKYRAALGKVETKPGWPEKPAWPIPPVPLETNKSVSDSLDE